MKKQHSLLLVLFLIISLIPTLNNHNITEVQPLETNSSIYSITLDWIKINGTEDFATQALANGWSGNGSQFNPYLISGLDLYGLRISHVDCYFSVYNSSLTYLYFTDVMNGQIIQNILHSYNYGVIRLWNSSLNHITNNSCFGITLSNSPNNTIINNIFTENGGRGGYIDLYQSADNIITGNKFTDPQYGALNFNGDDLDSYIQREVINNSVDGESILYWSNQVNESISIEAGQLILVNCSQIKLVDINLTHRLYCHFSDYIEIFNNTLDYRLYLGYSSNCNISNNNMKGIDLRYSNNNNVRNNLLEKYSTVSFSTNNRFINNTINEGDFEGYPELPYSGYELWGWEYMPYAIQVYSSQDNIFVNNTFPNAYQGIWLCSSQNNLLTRNLLLNSGDSGIKLSSSFNNTLSHNTLVDSIYSIARILLSNSTNNNLLRNNLSSIYFIDSSLNIIKDNLLRSELLIKGATIESYIQAEVKNNSINGKPLLYWYNKINETVPMGAGQIFLVNCSTISISNQVDCSIVIHSSQRLSITNNTVNTGKYHGISLSASTYCSISNNHIRNISNYYSGIHLYHSSNNNITNNEIKDSYYGIIFIHSSGNVIGGNVISNNTWEGVLLDGSHNNIIKDNFIAENRGYGLMFSYGSTNNTIILNSFVNNNLDAPDRESQAAEDFTHNADMDNRFYYNYWSDWTSPDDNHDNIIDLPYTIEGYPEDTSPQISQDSYPLAISPHSPFRVLIPPQIIVPNGREIIKGSITLDWLPAYDTHGSSVKYTVYYSVDSGTNWIMLVANLEVAEFMWNVSTLPSGSFYLIKVVATFDDGTTVSDISDEVFTILNPITTTSTTTSAHSSFPTFSMVLLVGLFLGIRRKVFKRGKNYKSDLP